MLLFSCLCILFVELNTSVCPRLHVLIGTYCRSFASLLSNVSHAFSLYHWGWILHQHFRTSWPTCFQLSPNNRRPKWEIGGSEGRRHQIISLILSARKGLFCVLSVPSVPTSQFLPSCSQADMLQFQLPPAELFGCKIWHTWLNN